MTISPLAEHLRITLYRHLANTGQGLPIQQAAQVIGVSPDAAREAIRELAKAHHLVLDEDDEILLAHPFATRSFRFSVMGPKTLWWGGCAWDAFAIPHLVPDSPTALVATTCPSCGTPHAWTVTNRHAPTGSQVAHFLVPADEIWPDAAHACENQQIFCGEGCVTRWLETTGNSRGYVMSLETLWRLAAHWYDGRLETPYERREPKLAAEYFHSVGLTGRFWGLG